MTRYLRRVYHLPAELEELVVAALWEVGTLGIEEVSEDGGRVRLIAYFDAVPGGDRLLPERVGERRGDVTLSGDEWIEAADWMAAHRRSTHPAAVGRFLVVDPREPGDGGEEEVASEWPDRRLLRLPARTAFGTGSHPSTRLAAELLEGLELAGRSVLDVGCGSGILSFAAALFGARRVVGLDVDAGAALLAGQYGRDNRVAVSLLAGTIDALAAGTGFDVAVVNVLPHRIEEEVDGIVARVRPRGRVVVSGLLTTEEAEVGERWRAAGLAGLEWRREEEWSAFVGERGPAGGSTRRRSARIDR